MKRWLSIAVAVMAIISMCGAKIVYYPPKWDEEKKVNSPSPAIWSLK